MRKVCQYNALLLLSVMSLLDKEGSLILGNIKLEEIRNQAHTAKVSSSDSMQINLIRTNARPVNEGSEHVKYRGIISNFKKISKFVKIISR